MFSSDCFVTAKNQRQPLNFFARAGRKILKRVGNTVSLDKSSFRGGKKLWLLHRCFFMKNPVYKSMLIFGRSLTHLLYIQYVLFKVLCHEMNIFFYGTFCTSSDCLTNFWLAFCVDKLKIKFLFAPKS